MAIALLVTYGILRWNAETRSLLTRLEEARRSPEPGRFDARELVGLPAPVQRYLRAVMRDGQPLIAAVSIEHTGLFNMNETGEDWKPFTSTQRVITKRPGFDWEARIAMAPGLKVRVHDAYVAGEGILHASLFGLVSMVDLRGTPEMAEGELMRFFAETAWYPTALLPSQGVRWEAVDDSSARATMSDGDLSISLLFRFDEQDMIDSVRAEARGRMVSGEPRSAPWEGRWSAYELRDGMRIPLDGEVTWILREGPKPYWRGRIRRVEFEYAFQAAHVKEQDG